MDIVDKYKLNFSYLVKNNSPEKLLVYLANDMSYHDHFVDAFNSYYETKKIEFYEKAVKSEFYNASIFSDKKLSQEISMRRIFAILLSAEENEESKTFVWKTIESFSKTKNLIKILKKGNSYKYLDYINSLDVSDNSLMCLTRMVTLYYIYCNFGFDTEIKHYKSILIIEFNNCAARLSGFYNVAKDRIDAINYFDHVVFNPLHRKTFKSINTLNDFLSILDTDIKNNGIDISQLSNKLKAFYDAEQSFENIFDIDRFLNILTRTFNYFGLSPTSYFQAISLTDEDRANILKIAAKSYAINPHAKFPELPFYYFILTTFLYYTAKSIKEDRDCFFENNSETQFFALKESAKKIDDLTAELLSLRDQINIESSEKEKYIKLYSSLQDEVLSNQQKSEKEIYSAFKSELDSLKDRIVALESQLVEKEKDSQELYRLRELAFSLESDSPLSEPSKSIEELTENKKVVIIGGHINLRKKLSDKYKTLIFLDGHNVNFDENALRSADIVLFNTANMSHSLYYKIIPVLKNNSIKFDYISRSLNLEILENEIGSLLKKHFT